MWPTLLVACSSALMLVAGECDCADPSDGGTEWWRTAILYQIYPRSFKDSDGDGVGDLRGIIERSCYLKEIGVEAIFMNPIFKSPMVDYGYDIANYCEIDPLYGTLEDFLDLLCVLHELGIKVLLDLVPNHTSDEHEWFVKSVNREEPYTDYYVWVDGIRDPATNATRPPNNWLSNFTGIAWEYNEQRQQYYLHQFSKHQPDLNFRNRRVVDEINAVIRYWLDLGIDGWRVDAVPFYFEDCQLRNESALPGTNGDNFQALDHNYTENLPDTYRLTREWASIIHDCGVKCNKSNLVVLEAYANVSQTVDYFGTGNTSIMQPLNFFIQSNGSLFTNATGFRDIILRWLNAIPKNASTNWVVGSHDQGRVANRYGPATVDAITMLTGILPGMKVVYNGDEIGMENTFVRFDQTVDPGGLLQGPATYQYFSRDPERTPMQWDSSLSAGFSTNRTTWLPVNPNYYYLNVAQQKSDARSHLKVFQDVARARQDPVLKRGSVDVIAPDSDTLLVIRKLNDQTFMMMWNVGSFVRTYTSDNTFIAYGVDDNYTVNVSSINAPVNKGTSFNKGSVDFSLRPRAAVILRTTFPNSSGTSKCS